MCILFSGPLPLRARALPGKPCGTRRRLGAMRFSAFHAAERFHPPGKYIVRPGRSPDGPFYSFISGCSAVGSAPALGAGCRRFKSCHSDQSECSYGHSDFFIWQSAVMNIRTKLSLDAICVPGSAFSFALSPALTACRCPSTSTSGKLPLPSHELLLWGLAIFLACVFRVLRGQALGFIISI